MQIAPPEHTFKAASALHHQRRERLFVVFLLLAIPLLYFYPAVIGDTALMPGDGWSQNVGVRVLLGRMLMRGFLPLWNPYMFGGVPFLASAYPGVLYPPNWLFALLPYQIALNAVIITTYHIALIGTYLLARQLGLSRVASLITGIVYTFCGYMITHLGHTPRIAAAAWLPWLLLAIECLYQQVAWRWIALGAVALALQLLASEPQVALYTLLVAGGYVVFASVWREATQPRWRFWLAAAASVALGLALGALQVFPSLELMRYGERAALTYDYFSEASFPPSHLLTFIYPYFFGGMALTPYRVEYWGFAWLSELGGYAGVLSLLLALVALVARRQRLVWFWAGLAVIATVLSFGDFLPFGLNKFVLFQLPAYNKFRGSARHLMEVGLAIAMLAGFGVQALQTLEASARRRVLLASSGIFLALFAAVAVCYNFAQGSFHAWRPRPANAMWFGNPEQLIPLALCGLSLLAVWWFAHQPRVVAGACLVVLMMFDLASFGHRFEWIEKTFADAPLADPPTVAFIKARETNRHSFRVVSQAPDLHGDNRHLLNGSNLSQMRGLQTVQGFDVLLQQRYGQLTGDLGVMGEIKDLSVYGNAHQGLNLLNVKYLLYEKPANSAQRVNETIAGWRFATEPLELKFNTQTAYELSVDGFTSTKIGLLSALGNAAAVPNGTPLARLRLHTSDGQMFEHTLQVGRDASEWAWDRPDTNKVIKHQRAIVARSWPDSGFEGHEYLAEFAFPRATITRIEIHSLLKAEEADWTLGRVSLLDETTGQTAFPARALLPAERWRKLEDFGAVELYENLKAMPRAWLVKELQVMPKTQVLQTIKSGKLPDGGSFNPGNTALLEQEDFGGRQIELPVIGDVTQGQVTVTRYEPNQILLATDNTQPGFLVVSENYYRGWEAWVDGRRAPVQRVNYNLRGLALPAGQHRVQFLFRSSGVRVGAAYFAVGVVALLGGACASWWHKRRRS